MKDKQSMKGYPRNIIIAYDFNFINGGAAQVAILTANMLAKAGYNVTFFSGVFRPEESQLIPEVHQVSSNDHDILTNPSRINAFINGIWNKKAARLFKTVLQKFDPSDTIIHVHGWSKSLSPAIGKLLSNSGFASVYTLHDYFIACPNGGFYNYPKNEICHFTPLSLQCICSNCDARSYSHKLWRVARQAIQKYVAGMPGKITDFIMVSKFSEQILRPQLPSNANIHFIGNPLPHIPDKPKANTNSGRFLVVGRLSPEKGIDIACLAAREANVRLTVIGSGEQLESLQQQFPEVEFKGWMRPDQVLDEMLHSTALIFPSIWYETQGLVVLEALSIGLPVIVSNESAASEFVDNQNGFIFKSKDYHDLAQKIKLIASDPHKTAQMSHYAYNKYWENPNTIDAYLDKLIKVYTSILNRLTK